MISYMQNYETTRDEILQRSNGTDGGMHHWVNR
jgi:hypothetical protein